VSAADDKLLSASASSLALAGIARAVEEEQDPPGLRYWCVDRVLHEGFEQQKNQHRMRFHRELQERLEAKLKHLLDTPSPPDTALSASEACRRIAHFGAEHALEGGPLLQGLRRVLHDQIATKSRTIWVLDDAAFLNVGDRALPDAVGLLRQAGLQVQSTPTFVEAGGMQPGHRCWAVRPGVWSRSQVRTIASSIKPTSSVAATGRVVHSTLEPGEEAVLRPSGLLGWCPVL